MFVSTNQARAIRNSRNNVQTDGFFSFLSFFFLAQAFHGNKTFLHLTSHAVYYLRPIRFCLMLILI